MLVNILIDNEERVVTEAEMDELILDARYSDGVELEVLEYIEVEGE